jgi:type VI secretion system protein ImpM
MSGAGSARGFFGKIPSRGDFVRAGLPSGFVRPWDEWLQRVVAGSRIRLGADWLPAWMEAPVWRFLLPGGTCGPDTVLGVWMPSVDLAGRHFPLTLAMVTPSASVEELLVTGAGWLDMAERAGLDALQNDLSPEELALRLDGAAGESAPVPEAVAGGGWWTEGSPYVPPSALARCHLPDASEFASMLFVSAPGDGPRMDGETMEGRDEPVRGEAEPR